MYVESGFGCQQLDHSLRIRWSYGVFGGEPSQLHLKRKTVSPQSSQDPSGSQRNACSDIRL